MSDTEGAGSAEATTETPGASGSQDSSDLESKLAAARDEAAKNRIAKREATQAAETANKAAAEAQKRLEAVMKAAGLEVDENGGADIEAIQAAATAKERKALDALIRSEAKARALSAGVRPDRVDQALKLMDFSSVDADLDTLEVSGVDDAITAVLEEMPELKSTSKPAPGVDTRTPGKKSGGLDFQNLQPGDVTRMSSEEFIEFMKTNPEIKTGRFVQDANGNLVAETWKNGIGGNTMDKTLRRAQRERELMEKALGER